MDVAGDLAREQRLLYRAEFQSQVAAGARTPLLFHIYIVGSQLLPALYLAIPHRRRPWLYRARWLVLAAAAGLQWWMLRNGSSASFAGAYGVGLLAAWGLIWNLALLVWTRPQWEARRVVRRRGAARAAGGREAAPRGEAPEAASDVAPSRRLNGSGSNGHAVRERRKNGGVSEQKAPNGELKLNGKTESADVDVDASGNGQEYIYEWQEFPENESFLTRLGWAFSLTTSLRLTGNQSPSPISVVISTQLTWSQAGIGPYLCFPLAYRLLPRVMALRCHLRASQTVVLRVSVAFISAGILFCSGSS